MSNRLHLSHSLICCQTSHRSNFEDGTQFAHCSILDQLDLLLFSCMIDCAEDVSTNSTRLPLVIELTAT